MSLLLGGTAASVSKGSYTVQFTVPISTLKTLHRDKLSRTVATIVALNEQGLLEPYILMEKMDKEISVDYHGYIKANAATMKKYVFQWKIKPQSR